MRITLENFISFCDEMEIAEEGMGYTIMRKAQTSKISLNHQLRTQKSELDKKVQNARTPEEKEVIKNIILKRKASIERKINGKEISDKETLRKFITLYDGYLHRL